MLLGLCLTAIIILFSRNRLVLFPVGTVASCLAVFLFRRYNIKHQKTPFLKYEFFVLIPFILIYTGPLIYAVIEIKNITNLMIYFFVLLSGCLGYCLAGIKSKSGFSIYLLISYLFIQSLLGIYFFVPYSLVVWNNIQKTPLQNRVYRFPKQMTDLITGKPITLFDKNAKYYAFETWDRTCGSCIDEMNDLSNSLEKLSQYPLHLYIINTGDSMTKPENRFPLITRLKQHPQITFLYDNTNFFRDSLKAVEVPDFYIFNPEKRLLEHGYFRYNEVAFNYNFFNRINYLLKENSRIQQQ